MENFVSALKSMDSSWLTPSFTTWAMDMIFAFVCGVGLFHLLLPLLPLNSPSPPPVEKTTTQKVVKKERIKVRKKTRNVRGYRGCRKKPKEDKVLVSLLHSILRRLVKSISFCRLLRRATSGEDSNPEAAKVHLPPGQLKEESVATKSLGASSAPLQEHLLPQNSKILSPVLLDSSASTGSQLSMSDSQEPETLTPGRHHSPPPPPTRAPSVPSHPPDPVACPQCIPDPSTMSPQCEGKALWNTQSIPLPGFPSPVPTSLGLDQSHRPNTTIPGSNDFSRPTSTTPSLNNSIRPTSTNPGLEKQSRSISKIPELKCFGRPTKTKSDIANSSRPTTTTQGFDQTSRPVARPSWYQVAAKAWFHSNLAYGESKKIEAGEPFFINPDLELQNRKRVELKVNNGIGKGKSDHALGLKGSMLESWIHSQTNTTSQTFWSRNCTSEKFAGHQQSFCQKALGYHLPMKYSQLFWGLPFLHSESLAATIYMAESLQDVPVILFNVLPTYIPIHHQTMVPPQIFYSAPLLHHSVKPQTLIHNLPSTRAPAEPEFQTQALEPSSIAKPPCHPPLIMDYGTFCTTSTRSQFTVPSAGQHLEHHLLKKQQESAMKIPAMLNNSQEACNPRTSNSWVPQGHESVVHLQGEFINPKIREQLEQHLEKSFIQLHGQWPQKVQLALDLMKSQDKLAGMGEAKVNGGDSPSSSLAHESSQHPLSVTSEGADMIQPRRGPEKDAAKCLGRVKREHYWRPEGHRGKLLEEISDTQEETYHLRPPRRDSPAVSPLAPGKKPLEETLKNYSGSKWRCTKESKVPVGTCQGVSVNPAMVSCVNSNANMNPWIQPSMNDATIFQKTSEAAFPDAGTQKVLETHLTRRLVRHRWRLPLRGLKIIHVLNENKATSPPSNTSVSSWDSRGDGTDRKASVLAEALQKQPEEKVMEITSTLQSPSTPKLPPALQLEFLKEPPTCDNSGPSAATTTPLEDDLISASNTDSLMARAWQDDKILKTWIHHPDPTPARAKGVFEPQKSGSVVFKEMHKGLSDPEFSVASQSTIIGETGHLEEAPEEEAYNTEAWEMAKPPINSESLETCESPSHSRPGSQGPEQSGLSTHHCLAHGVILQGCATGTFLQKCAPEVLPAADIWESRSSQSSFKTVSPPNKSPFQDSNTVSCRENFTRISKRQELWTTHIFGPNYMKDYGIPQQEVHLSGKSPLNAHGSNNHEKKFGDKIKHAIVSIFTAKDKGQGNLLQKVKAFPGSCQSQGRASCLSRFFRHLQVPAAQNFMNSVGRVLQERLRIHSVHASSQKNEHPDPHQAPVRRQVCCDRIPTAQPKVAQGNTGCVHKAHPKVHSMPFNDKWMPHTTNQAQVSMSPAGQYQHRAQALVFPSSPTHCPRHCPCRSSLCGRARAFPYLK